VCDALDSFIVIITITTMSFRRVFVVGVIACAYIATCVRVVVASSSPVIVVVGSVNADVIARVERVPLVEETVSTTSASASFAVGGKGANQAVAAARLAMVSSTTGGVAGASASSSSSSTSTSTSDDVMFVGKFGSDEYGTRMWNELETEVDLRASTRSVIGSASGMGFVMLNGEGLPSAVVVGGANALDWNEDDETLERELAEATRGASTVMLQREIPERVNRAAVRAARKVGVERILLDAGGSHGAVDPELLASVDYVAPNEIELAGMAGVKSVETDEDVVSAARSVIGNTRVKMLCTLGARGAMLVYPGTNGEVIRVNAEPLPKGLKEVDATAAGDAFRAAFAVGLSEGKSERDAMRFAAAAGALTVTKIGAMPSLPTRSEVDASLGEESASVGKPRKARNQGARAPLRFASRLNSMKARPDLFPGKDSRVPEVFNLIKRMATVDGISSVFLNFPEHFLDGKKQLRARDLKKKIESHGLVTGAVCVRFPEEYRLGAFTNPDEVLRSRAEALVRSACAAATSLDAEEVVIWPRYDGYDYHLQADYAVAWENMVQSYRRVASSDDCASLKVSVEFKPTDEKSRFSFIPTTGAAILLAQAVGAPNFGLTLDVGHMIAAGENPAQSVSMAATRGLLFGLQLGDGYSRLGAEDGLLFASVNQRAAFEIIDQLYRFGYAGALYFDTFPLNEDPTREAESNIRVFSHLWRRVAQLAPRIDTLRANRDAIGIHETLLSS